MPRHTPKYPERVAEIERMIRVDKLTYSDIANRLDITRSAVASVVRRWIKGIPDDRIREPKKTWAYGDAEPPPAPRNSMRALAQFDPVIARALKHREALIASKKPTTDGA